MMQVPFKTRKDVIALFFLLFLSVVFFAPVLFGGRTFYAFDTLQAFFPWSVSSQEFDAHNSLITDPVNVFYPVHHLLQEAVRDGVLPLWNGSNFCGAPFSPPSNPFIYLFYAFLPLTTAHDLLLWFHLVGTGLFMYLYLRELGLKLHPSLIGSVAWMFNGYVMVWFEFENAPMMAFTLPATLFAIERYLEKRSRTAFLLIVCFTALAASVHYAHLLFYQCIFLGFYVPYRCFSFRREGPFPNRVAWKPLLLILLAFSLGMAVSANFFTVHLSVLEGSQREVHTFKALFDRVGQLPVKYLATLFFSEFFGSPAGPFCFTPGTQSYANFNELCLYAGIPTLLLALTCVPFMAKRHTGFFAFTALVSLTMAMGSVLYYPLARFIPGLALSTPTRILYIFGFAMAVLAAMGAEHLLRGEVRRRTALGLWGAILGLGVAAALFMQTERGIGWAGSGLGGDDQGRIHQLLTLHFDILSEAMIGPLLLGAVTVYVLCVVLFTRNERIKRLFLALTVILLSYDLISFGLAYNTASKKDLEYPVTEAIGFLKKDRSLFRIMTYGKFMHNGFAPFGIEDAGGYSSFYPKRYGDYMHLSQHGPEAPLPARHNRWMMFGSFGSPLLDLINVKYLLVSPGGSLGSAKVRLVYDKEIKIYENKHVLPRLFFVPTYSLLKSGGEVYGAIGRMSERDTREKVILESAPPRDFLSLNTASKDHFRADIRILSYGPNRIGCEISTDRKGFLVISDNYHPGWQATVDGGGTRVLRANYIMRAVPVKEGYHRVELLFRPKLIIAGMVTTIIGWSVLIGFMGALAFRRILRGPRGKGRDPV